MTAEDVADQLLRDLAPLDPVAAATLGKQPYVVMPRLAPADFAARREAWERALQSLNADQSQPRSQAVLRAALSERLRSDIALDQCGFTRSLLAPLATPMHEVREVFDSLPRTTRADWARIAEHLALVPAAMRAYADTLRDSAANDHVASQRQVLGAASQCEQWIGPDAYYERLASARPEDPDVMRASIMATSATAEFAAFLRDELLPLAPDRDKVGRDIYAVTGQSFLGEDVDLAETYELGWQELATLTVEMRRCAEQLGAESVEQAVATLDADPTYQLSTPAQLLAWLQSRVHETVDAVDGVHFDLPPVAREPECRISDASAGVMYYAQPDPAFTRPGRIVWAPGEVSHSWREVTTLHHEGVPGHHLQIVTALAEQTLHPWQRAMAHVHGYVEGWAHYSERLCDELGLIRDPAERLGMLFGQRWRAARIVIDMGLHLDLPIPPGVELTTATRWDPDVAVAALRSASGLSQRAATFEVDRYLGWPGQALAFRVGARLWQEIRDKAAARPGFDLRSFHMSALRLGPMGLGPLRSALLS